MGIEKNNVNNYNDKYLADAERMARHFIDAAGKLKEKGEAALVFPHRSVDGDCVGSACGLALVLRALGAAAYVAMPERLPEDMSFLGIDDLLFFPWDVPSFENEPVVDGKPYIFYFMRGHRLHGYSFAAADDHVSYFHLFRHKFSARFYRYLNCFPFFSDFDTKNSKTIIP